jgi:hypothetical protein
MRRGILFLFTVGLLASVGCNRGLLRKPNNDCCPNDGKKPSTFGLGDPVPSGSRIPPSNVPTDDFPQPRIPGESRYSIDPYGLEGRRVSPSDKIPTSPKAPPKDVPLPTEPGAYERPMKVPAPGGLLGDPVPPSGLRLPPNAAPVTPTPSDLPPRNNNA